jgi:hypothetical protein
MITRRVVLASAFARLLGAAPKRPEIVNAYYFRAHMYTMVPRHVREDLKWMADAGCNAVTLAVLEQDLFAAVENIEIVCNEAAKAGLRVLATPSRWAGLTAGAPKTPSLFSATHPETWMRDAGGKPFFTERVSGVISSVHHPATHQFFCETFDRMFGQFPFAGFIWDEPKGFRPDYLKLPADSAKETHWQAAADFYARVSRYVREKHPAKSISMFIQANANAKIVELGAAIEPLDYFGCDGRPWDLAADKQWAGGGDDPESGKGKTLIGPGERFLSAARERGKKTMVLAENHNLPAKMIPAMEAGLPRVLALAPDHLIFYYYPRNIEDPDRNMTVIRQAIQKINLAVN